MSGLLARWRLSRRIAPSNLRTHADQVQHSRRPTSAPVRNRFYLFYISFFSSSIYLCGTPRGPIPLPDRSPPIRPGFSPPDSVPWCQTAPRSPRWLIGLSSVRKESPARGIFTPAPTPASPSRSRPSRSRRRSRTRLPGRPRSPLPGRTRSPPCSACSPAARAPAYQVHAPGLRRARA